jgi:hypothetical protein
MDGWRKSKSTRSIAKRAARVEEPTQEDRKETVLWRLRREISVVA